MSMWKRLAWGLLGICCGLPAHAATASPLFARGYTVIPSPQKVNLEANDFEFSGPWRLELGSGIKAGDVAVESLKEQLRERFHVELVPAGKNVVRLDAAANTVSAGAAVTDQAYRIELAPNRIAITGNASAGAFYGVQTLVQLLKTESGKLWLPQGTIEDWPDLELRAIYWDDAHHLEHLDVLKDAVRQASFYKINGFALKLEGHFQYQHAQPVVEPYALTPAEVQELTDYALKYHVEFIPYLDGPAHVAFILKHPEYAGLREYPESNYEFCITNPKTYELLQGMFDDLLAASKGGKYFVLSTDEPYYVGLANNPQCDEVTRAKELGSIGKLLAEFVTKTAGYLHDRGRTVLFWGEYPLKPADIASLPPYMVNGELYGPEFDAAFRARGIRQMIFTSTVGWKEYLFPNYYLLPQEQHLPGPAGGTYQPVTQGPGVVADMFDFISYHPERQVASILGTFIAGWADVGLHPETMWLGYATGSAAGWHPGTPDPKESMNSFYRLFYGPGGRDLGRMYQLLSGQGQFWKESWDVKRSTARTPLWGDYNIIYDIPHPSEDQTLTPLPVPRMPLLTLGHDWEASYAKRLGMAGDFLAQNDELMDLIRSNQTTAPFHKYNLQVFLSIAGLFRQNLEMLLGLREISAQLKIAEAAAGRSQSADAVAALDQALEIAAKIRNERNIAYNNASDTWYQRWFPRVAEANGRRFVDKVDDVKDHLPVRTVDLTYLIYRELLYPLDDWASQTLAARNAYAEANHLPARSFSLQWNSTAMEAQQ